VLGDDGEQLVGIFLNGRSIRQLEGLGTPVADGDEIRLTPPIAGG
jgi:molybdopterin converting factor small subunit